MSEKEYDKKETIRLKDSELVKELKAVLEDQNIHQGVESSGIELYLVYDENDFPLVGPDTGKRAFNIEDPELISGLKAVLEDVGETPMIDEKGITLAVVYDEGDFPVVGKANIIIKTEK